MNSTLSVINQIVEASKAHKATPRKITGMKPGEVVRQGDLYIEKLESLPEVGEVTNNTQLAIGQTQGSRHIISPKPVNLTIYSPPKGASALQGPFVSAPSAWTLTHPEHGNYCFEAGAYKVTYQRDYAKERAEELRRVSD